VETSGGIKKAEVDIVGLHTSFDVNEEKERPRKPGLKWVFVHEVRNTGNVYIVLEIIAPDFQFCQKFLDLILPPGEHDADLLLNDIHFLGKTMRIECVVCGEVRGQVEIIGGQIDGSRSLRGRHEDITEQERHFMGDIASDLGHGVIWVVKIEKFSLSWSTTGFLPN
jgi:hypothetical protein